jgi:hypothetical protein
MASTLPTTETSALAAPNTPTRRSSWKTNPDLYTRSFTDEKPPAFGASSNPFSPNYTEYHLAVPTLPSTPPALALNPDIEAQPCLFPTSRKRSRFRVCTTILCILLLWGVLSYGAMVLFGPMLPGANKIRELREEMVDMEAAVKMVREQIGGLVGYVEGVREWVGEMGIEWEGDAHGHGHEVSGFEHAGENLHDTVGGW